LRLNLGESILHSHSDGGILQVGDTVFVSSDLIVCDDLVTARAIELFRQMGGKEPVDKNKIVITCEHFTPPSNLSSAEIQNTIRKTAKAWGLNGFNELGRSGIGPILAVSQGLVHPGMLVIGTDPIVGALGGLGCFATAVGAGDIAALWKTGKVPVLVPNITRILITGKLPDIADGLDIALTLNCSHFEDITYRSFEFMGDGALSLCRDDRLELAFFMMETGAINAIIPPTGNLYVELDLPVDSKLLGSVDVDFTSDFTLNLEDIKPMIALPDLDQDIKSVEEFDEVDLDIVIIGGGMGGTLKNLRTLDRIIGGKKINPSTRLIIYPASSEIVRIAEKERIIGRLVDAGANICSPGRGIEGYGNRGLSTRGERVLINSTTHHQGIVGHVESEIYLASTKTCAVSAIAGKIISPGEVI
jgi:3-isopropylmalate/(R)-2-methylmalate dehydratase large subunit